MSDVSVEVLSANLVVIPTAPIAQIVGGPALFEASELKPYMKAVTVSQGLQLNAGTGQASPVFLFESMRSQRTVNISSTRIEVNDKSGTFDIDADGLARILTYLVTTLGISVGEVGTNFEVTFTLSEGATAAKAIAEHLFHSDASLIPPGTVPAGGAARVFLTSTNGIQYIASLEPRFGSLDTSEVWIICNADLKSHEMPSIEALSELILNNCKVVQYLVGTLFSISW